jgi:dynein intermediate chain 2
VAYQYTRPRSQFGRPCKFSSVPAQILESIQPTDEYDNQYRQRNPTTSEFDTTPLMSETEVNTERVIVNDASMCHVEGGWPKDVDFTEQSDVLRFRKKAEKDDSFQFAIRSLVPIVERCMKQNNTVDIYEHYFSECSSEKYTDPVSAKGIAVIRDPSLIKRTATSINWHPEANSSKIAVSYSILNFQDKRLDDSNFPSSVRFLNPLTMVLS